MRNHSCVVEPFAIGLDTGDGGFARLVLGGFGDVSFGVALGLAVGQTLEDLDLLCGAGWLSVLWPY